MKQFFIPPYEIVEIKKHMNELGVKTFPIVSITGFVIGLVIVMQSEPVFIRFGASDYLPGATAISIVRELAPVITALIFRRKGELRYWRRIRLNESYRTN